MLLIWGEGGQRGGLGGLPTPLVVLQAGGMYTTLLLLPGSLDLAAGVLGLFVSSCL